MKQINLRLPDDVHAELAAAADEDQRSINNMITVMIREKLRERESSGT